MVNNGQKQQNGAKGVHEIARYEQIAVDIAGKIARGEYAVGDKLYGRSVLAGQYNVSPETIRRAVALLQSVRIVQSEAGRGIMVIDRQRAVDYIENFHQRQDLIAAQQEFANLLLERQALDTAIAQQIEKILSYTSRLATLLPRVDDIYIPPNSPIVGKSLQQIGFRNKTGATVLAIERGTEEYLSPKSEDAIHMGDILIFVGDEDSRMRVEALVLADQENTKQTGE